LGIRSCCGQIKKCAYICGMKHEVTHLRRQGGKGYEDVVLKNDQSRKGMWLVADDLFCEKGGMMMDFLDRVEKSNVGGGIRTILLNRRSKGQKWRYVMVDWRALRLLEYCGKSISEGWCVQEGGNKPSFDDKDLVRYGIRVSRQRTAKGEYFSKDEIIAALGITEQTMRKYINLGFLTVRERKTKDYSKGQWTNRKVKYILADEYLELLLEQFGVICTGMTYEDFKDIMRLVGATTSGCRRTARIRHRAKLRREAGMERRLSKTYANVYLESAKYYYDKGVSAIISKYR